MSKFLFTVVFCLASVVLQAQSKYISYTQMGQEDRKVEGSSGVLILSKRNDLVISVNNAPKALVTPRGLAKNGLYEYEIIVDSKETPNPKMEISRRGDINKVNFVVKLRPGRLRAYMIVEVERPITMENQTTGSDAILNATKAEVEITTAISDLKVDCDGKLNAQITRSKKKADESITVISIVIPIEKLQGAKEKVASLSKEYDVLYNKKEKTEAEWNQLDDLEMQKQTAEKELADMCSIDLSAPETNHLNIDISDLGPRSKQCYGILLLRTVVREHVSKCSGMLEEAGRLFELRKYEDARRTFVNALSAEDAPEDIVPVINSNIAQCDSCIRYVRLTIGALTKIKQLKESGNVTQADIANYYTAAIDFMKIIEKYNPCEYYAKGINSLETFVANMPLDFRFRFVKWQVDRVSAGEDGPLPNVEVWAFYGPLPPTVKEYDNERKFVKLINQSYQYKQMGVSGTDGVVDLELSRKALPTGFFFRPTSVDGRTQIVYKDMTDIMAQSKMEYNKRQFRQKIYINK